MLNLNGQNGRDALPGFTAANFATTTAAPEPSTLSMFGAFALIGAACSVLRRQRARA
jgi:hypothetical protein